MQLFFFYMHFTGFYLNFHLVYWLRSLIEQIGLHFS